MFENVISEVRKICIDRSLGEYCKLEKIWVTGSFEVVEVVGS